jgi:uncharacterized protein YprB with RNaseH-like and TPR domain
MDGREQLASLRQTVARINRKYAKSRLRSGDPLRPEQPDFVEELLTGEVVETAFGSHFEAEKLYRRHHRHGSYDISDLIDLPADLLDSVSDGVIEEAEPGTWAFLDTETSGLGIGMGVYAFLIGVGSIDADGLRVRQFFMRSYDEEASMLHSLSAWLAQFDVLITYNGRTYDQPLLETRYAIRRVPDPFRRMKHFDLLYGARRLLKLRLEDCRLMNLENQILGVEREGDLAGELIPYCYFEYLRTHRAFRLIPIFHHNAVDIVSLACLTGLIPQAFRDPENAGARHGADLLGLARWLRISGRLEEALRVMRRAIELGLPDGHLFPALFETGTIERKLGLEEAALASFTELSLSPNPYRARAWEELAKAYEHRKKEFPKALENTRAARALADSTSLASREQRLVAKCLQARHRGPKRVSSSRQRLSEPRP